MSQLKPSFLWPCSPRKHCQTMSSGQREPLCRSRSPEERFQRTETYGKSLGKKSLDALERGRKQFYFTARLLTTRQHSLKSERSPVGPRSYFSWGFEVGWKGSRWERSELVCRSLAFPPVPMSTMRYFSDHELLQKACWNLQAREKPQTRTSAPPLEKLEKGWQR